MTNATRRGLQTGLKAALAFGGVLVLLIAALATFIYAYGQADHAAPADVIIVLGGGVEADGSGTLAQQRRVAHGAVLYQRGLAPWILCTGGVDAGRTVSEAQVCVDLLRWHGVPDAAILREDISLTTLSNAVQARQVMDAHGLHTALVVSDNFHLFRAEWLFRHFGLAVVMSPAQITQGPIAPGEALKSLVREVFALPWNAAQLWILRADHPT